MDDHYNSWRKQEQQQQQSALFMRIKALQNRVKKENTKQKTD